MLLTDLQPDANGDYDATVNVWFCEKPPIVFNTTSPNTSTPLAAMMVMLSGAIGMLGLSVRKSVRIGLTVLCIEIGELVGHGFVVVGWGPIETGAETCKKPIETRYDSLPISRTDAKQQWTNVIPYVVDYAYSYEEVPRQRIQTPVARPFYCSKYDDQDTTATDTYFGIGGAHVWYFIHLNDQV